MTGDGKTDPELGKVQPAGASRAEPSMDELSRQFGERLARQRTVDPAAAASARRAALEAYDLARERRLIAGLSIVLALTVGASVAYFVSTIESRPVAPLPSAAAQPEPAQSLEIASAAPAPVPPDSPFIGGRDSWILWPLRLAAHLPPRQEARQARHHDLQPRRRRRAAADLSCLGEPQTGMGHPR